MWIAAISAADVRQTDSFVSYYNYGIIAGKAFFLPWLTSSEEWIER